MGRLGIVAALVVALILVVFGVIVWARGPTTDEQANLVDMQQSAATMQQSGQTMQTHGQAMLDEGQRTGDQELIAHGKHWTQDGQALVQGGQWMAMNPTSPGSLVADPADLKAEGSWGELTRTAQQMLHDPSKAREVDLEALNWNGEAMRAEGRNMADHGWVMAEDAAVMVERHNLDPQAAADLRAAAQTMIDVGGTLERNGKEMIDYAERIRKSLGK